MQVYPLLLFSCTPPEIKNQNGHNPEIWDRVRKKFVSLNSEEWVRQWLFKYLNEELHYPLALMSCERGLAYNGLSKRYDALVYNRAGQAWMLIECKSFKVSITEIDIQQAFTYNATVGASIVMLTNGLNHLVFAKNEAGTWAVSEVVPGYGA